MQFVHPSAPAMEGPFHLLGEGRLDGGALVHGSQLLPRNAAEMLGLFFISRQALALELRENGSEVDVASVLDGHGRGPYLG